MEGTKSPFPPASDVPLQRNPPLAPSQELAYRNKCIQLKKRLQEIEANNSQTRARISAEKERIQKQRLLRSILLHQLREIMETPGRKFQPEELERLGIPIEADMDDTERGRPDGEVLLDDSSEDSDDEAAEPTDRPARARRQRNYREQLMAPTAPPMNPSVYQPQGLVNLAPANTYSPAAVREPLLTTSFQTPVPAAASPQQYSAPQHFTQESHFPAAAQSSPIHNHAPAQPIIHHPVTTRQPSGGQPPQMQPVQPVQPVEPVSNGYSRNEVIERSTLGQPVRPSPPYQQFCEHMRPQLEADNYPREHIQSRIDEEWRKLSSENRGLWEDRYNEQMKDYEEQMDIWKRTQRARNEHASHRR